MVKYLNILLYPKFDPDGIKRFIEDVIRKVLPSEIYERGIEIPTLGVERWELETYVRYALTSAVVEVSKKGLNIYDKECLKFIKDILYDKFKVDARYWDLVVKFLSKLEMKYSWLIRNYFKVKEIVCLLYISDNVETWRKSEVYGHEGTAIILPEDICRDISTELLRKLGFVIKYGRFGTCVISLEPYIDQVLVHAFIEIPETMYDPVITTNTTNYNINIGGIALALMSSLPALFSIGKTIAKRFGK